MVITDPLTGCRNRRFFDEIIGRELQRHRRYGIPLSLLFVDIDRFKAVNDSSATKRAIDVLREVAAFLLANIREADYVFRWGGDEFLVLLSCNEHEARRRGAALQTRFRELAARRRRCPPASASASAAPKCATACTRRHAVSGWPTRRMYREQATRATAEAIADWEGRLGWSGGWGVAIESIAWTGARSLTADPPDNEHRQ